MRSLLVLLLTAGTAIADAPPIDTAIADAARDKRLLVIEFGAQWCKPCVEFETSVLTDANVVRALATVAFVRYDVDTPIGEEAARRYRVNSYPTFLVLDAGGVVKFQHSGVPPGKAAIAWFMTLLHEGSAAQSPIDKLRSAVDANPDDPQARLALARALRDGGALMDALFHFRQVVALPNLPPLIAAEAEDQVVALTSARERVDAVVTQALQLADKYPGSPVVSLRLAVVAAANKSPEELARAIAAHLAAVRPIDRPNAVRVALLAGAAAQARNALVSWTDGDRRSFQLMGAELALWDGKRTDAQRLVDTTCKAAATDIEAWCLDLYNALRGASRTSLGVMRLRMEAATVIDNLTRPGRMLSNALPVMSSNAMARAMLEVDRRCGPLAGKTPRVFVEVYPTRTDVIPDDNVDLRRCIRETIAAAKLGGEQHHGYLIFDHAQDREPRLLGRTRFQPGVSLTGANRWGAVGTRGLAIDTLLDVGSLVDLRVLFSVQLEGSIAESGDVSYLGRALIGLGVISMRDTALSLQVGLGGSTYGDDAPGAFEVPFAVRLRQRIRFVNLHLWSSGAFLFADDREMEDGAGLVSADELGFGAAASVPWGRDARVFGGASYEDRAAGRSGVVFLGISAGYF